MLSTYSKQFLELKFEKPAWPSHQITGIRNCVRLHHKSLFYEYTMQMAQARDGTPYDYKNKFLCSSSNSITGAFSTVHNVNGSSL